MTLVYCPQYTCPRCCNRTGSCCACQGTGVLALQTAFVKAMAYAWRVDDCEACRRNGTGPR